MSLVHEALRKAEREKQRKLGSVPPTSHPVAPQPMHTPPVHAPATPAPAAFVEPDAIVHRPVVTDRSVPADKEPKEANHFLLPSLIACVAIVAIIAIVFLVSSASSVLRQSKDSPVTTAALAAPAPSVKSTVPSEPQPPAQSLTQPAADTATSASTPPPTLPAADGSKFTLSGIMQDPDGKYVAIINGHVTYEGTSVGGATVKSIDRDHAVLDLEGHESVLRLF